MVKLFEYKHNKLSNICRGKIMIKVNSLFPFTFLNFLRISLYTANFQKYIHKFSDFWTCSTSLNDLFINICFVNF